MIERHDVVKRWDRPDIPVMTEAELIHAHGGLPVVREGMDVMTVQELNQRAVAAAICEAEARLAERFG